MRREHRPVDELWLLLPEQALQAEQERVLLAPLDARLVASRRDLLEGSVERPPPCGAGFQRFAVVGEGLARELLDTLEIFLRRNLRGPLGHFSAIGHLRLVGERTPSRAGGGNTRPLARRQEVS